jgi:hypothetical protein
LVAYRPIHLLKGHHEVTADPHAITSIFKDYLLLKPWVSHYLSLGYKWFHIGTDPSTYAITKQIVEGFGINCTVDVIYGKDYPPYASGRMYQLQTTYCGADDWICVADLDEFHEYPVPLKSLLDDRYTVVAGTMVDRISMDGTLRPLNGSSLFKDFPIQCNLTKALSGGEIRKVALVRGHRAPLCCYHWVQDEVPNPAHVKVHHFKWTSGLYERLRDRVNKLDVNYMEYRRAYEHILKYGRIDSTKITGFRTL